MEREIEVKFTTLNFKYLSERISNFPIYLLTLMHITTANLFYPITRVM